MYFVDEVGEGLLYGGPALIPELLHCRSLGRLPERQSFEECAPTGPCEGQDAAAVTSFRSDGDIALLLERPQISRQRRAFHFQRIGQRFDRQRATRTNGRQHRNLCRAQSHRPKRLVIGAGDDA